MSDPLKDQNRLDVYNHPRLSELDRLVYPVVSRRTGGLSLGINLNPEKSCSFNCVYCQVDRSIKIRHLKPDLNQILSELDQWLSFIKNNGGTYQGHSLKDISIAGDGEPTLKKILPQLITQLVEKKKQYGFREAKLILFTNGSNLTRSDLMKVLNIFSINNGEIWFKLDFWDAHSYQMRNRSIVPYSKIIQNLEFVGRKYPLVIQSCFFAVGEHKVNPVDYREYASLITTLIENGLKIKEIQVYTTARKPAESFVTPISDKQMDEIHDYLISQLTCKIVSTYQGGKEPK